MFCWVILHCYVEKDVFIDHVMLYIEDFACREFIQDAWGLPSRKKPKQRNMVLNEFLQLGLNLSKPLVQRMLLPSLKRYLVGFDPEPFILTKQVALQSHEETL